MLHKPENSSDTAKFRGLAQNSTTRGKLGSLPDDDYVCVYVGSILLYFGFCVGLTDFADNFCSSYHCK